MRPPGLVVLPGPVWFRGVSRAGGGPECFPGGGIGSVREIIAGLLGRGYDGGLSIEPHITSVVHLGQDASDPRAAFDSYVEYGRRLEALVSEIRPA